MKKNLLLRNTLSLMFMLQLLCTLPILAQSSGTEKVLYSTTFNDWTNADATTTESTVTQTTKYSHETLDFSILGTQISSTNQNTSKFPNWTGGYLMAAKAVDSHIITSALKNITKVHFIHGATGSNRGWMLEAKGNGDNDWIPLSSSVANPASGADVTVDVNRTNCQLRFTNLVPSQNAYLFQLDIYGNVDLSGTPMLGSFDVNGKTYQAADIFNEDNKGNMTATIEISKKAKMISADNPLTCITATNGSVGNITYAVLNDTAKAFIPVTADGKTLNYIISFVWKPDFTLTYYNTDGSELGTQKIEKDAAISAFAYTQKDATIADGYIFRGWFESTSSYGNRKWNINDVITTDESLYAVATKEEKESKTERYVYNLTDKYFYDEDHEAFNSIGSGKFHDGTHGWVFSKGDSIKFLVGGDAYIFCKLCSYNKDSIYISNSKGERLTKFSAIADNDGNNSCYYYQGDKDTLSLTFGATTYLHGITIDNVADGKAVKNAADYYIVKAGDAENLLTTLDVANANASDESRTYIFVPKGKYELGETVLTPISGNNISIIGEDRDSTIIVNTPKVENEGISTTATFIITGNNTYFQDITLQNALDYYSSGSAGRAVVIQDKGNHTICKNVKMLSYQDTYYSNADGQYYFEGGEIHGTVDYVCGSGDVFYNKVKFVNESRNATIKYGDDVIAAPYPGTSVTKGYVFNNCTIENKAANFSLGRSWGGNSKLTYINTIIRQPNEIDDTRFTTAGMNTAAYSFKEYNSIDTLGKIVTPASNMETFKKDASSYTYDTTLPSDSVKNYRIENIFQNWFPETLTEQVKINDLDATGNNLTWKAADKAIAYAIYADGALKDIINTTSYIKDSSAKTYTVKAANNMGGFGDAITTVNGTTSINSLKNDTKGIIRTVYYSADGRQQEKLQRGINIIVRYFTNGQVKANKIIIKNSSK